ncbi:MAG: tetratricopeptide repeat protein [Candidatus Goldbacteria bacterium]|nr:tetratricopeptide repeat protein [Candidatus Goldiibacteriota bacterium]
MEISKEILKDIAEFKFDAALEKASLIKGGEKLRADILFMSGKFSEAEYIYSYIREKSWDTSLNRALIALSEGRIGDARALLLSIKDRDINPDNSPVYAQKKGGKGRIIAEINTYLGVLYKNSGDYNDALKCFRKAALNDSSNALIPANMGDIYFKQENNEQAAVNYLKAIKLTDDNLRKAHLYNDVGLVYYRQGLLAKAVESFKQSLIFDPEYKNAAHNLGMIYVKGGMPDKIKDDYKDLLKHEDGVEIVLNITRSVIEEANRQSKSGAVKTNNDTGKMMTYECVVKKGHAGAGSYNESKIYVEARSILEAMEKAKQRGGVKKGKSYNAGQSIIAIRQLNS